MAGARELWTLFEPIHAVTYFAPQARAAHEAAGLRGFWRGYFATRLAPLGAVDAPVATAVLFGFSPAMVARGVPAVWELTSPAQALLARLEGADSALREMWVGRDVELRRAAELLRQALAGAPVAGRALFAGNSSLPWPDAPRVAVWHGCTLLREHRGDGHVAALTAAGLDGCESLVAQAASGRSPAEGLHANRGWTDEQWQAAADRLTARGWLAGDRLTDAGVAARAGIEDATDRAAEQGVAGLSGPERSELAGVLRALAGPVLAAGIVPYPNPIGVPLPA